MAKFFRINLDEKHKSLIRYLGVPTILAVWCLVSLVAKAMLTHADIILPGPWDVFFKDLPGFATFWGQDGVVEHSSYGLAFLVLGKHSMITILRVLVGMAFGVFLGVGTALVMGWSKTCRWLFDWPVSLTRAIPTLALIPLFLLWFGGREIGNVIYITFSIFVILIVNALEAIRNVPPEYSQFASTLGATRGQIYKTVIIPAIVPGITGSIRVALGTAWATTLGAEYLAVEVGLGKLLILSEMFFMTGRMVVIALLFGLYSTILNFLVVRVLRTFTKWLPESSPA